MKPVVGSINCMVYFIDFGNIEWVDMEKLVILDDRIQKGVRFKALVQTPALALQCSLVNIKPNPILNPRGYWEDKETIEVFEQRINNMRVKCEVYSVTFENNSPIINMTLYQNHCNMNEALLTKTSKHKVRTSRETLE